MTPPTTVPITELPATVRDCLAARDARDVDRALAASSPTAEVVHEGRAYRGPAGIRTFLTTAGAPFTYTSELAFRFELVGGLVTRLRITA